ncbi:MAG: glutamate--tRNA ligase [Desulfurococcales archaeon]|nr:glutamate--tRNA ligase [Desulfurococcales archaeon]
MTELNGLEEIERIIWAYALKNALDYEGKAVTKSVISKVFKEKPGLKNKARNVIEIVNGIVEKVNSMTYEEQTKLFEQYKDLVTTPERRKKEVLPPLPNAVEGKVVTRFAPNPDFVIHLGNARPAILSHEYARKYKGRFILRFEDTDPRTKTPIKAVYGLIKEDLKWLGMKWDEEHIQSLRMSIFYKTAKELIEKGGAYVDICKLEESKKLIKGGIGCSTRKNPLSWQFEQFEKMIKGYYGEGEAVLRVKTDLNHPDISVRDWVAFRIIDTGKFPHPLVGDKYVAWPTYNFAVSVDDHLMGVTHILRGKEHMQNVTKQKFLFKHMGWEYPTAIHFGRVHFEGFIMSKSKIRELIGKEPDRFWGYDDPRFGTLRGLRRRGILSDAIKQLILEVGIKGIDTRITYTNLAAINRKMLDEKAHRIMFVYEPIEFTVESNTPLKSRVPVHPSLKDVRMYTVQPGDKVCINRSDVGSEAIRLLGLGNFAIGKDELKYIGSDMSVAREHKIPIIQWVPCSQKVNVSVYKPSGLEFLVQKGYSEPGILEYKVDDKLQFIRYGFVRVDKITDELVRVIFSHE